MLLFSFITLPDFSEMVATTTLFAGGMFSDLLPIALAIAGIVIGVLFVKLFVIKGLLAGVKKLTGRK